jgi:DNA-directed RNA polymerase alpha subunit
MQHLKQKGSIEFVAGRWRLATDAANCVIENEPVCDMECTEAEPLVLSSVPLGDLKIDTRLRNCLGRFGVETAEDVLAVREEDFADLSGVGEKTLRQLSELQKQLLSGLVEASCSHSEGAVQQDAFFLTSSLDGQRMSVRLAKRLDRYGANSLADALAVDDQTFLRIPGVGKNTLRELHQLQKRIIRLTGFHRNPAALHEVECGDGDLLADPIARLPIKSVTEVAALQ